MIDQAKLVLKLESDSGYESEESHRVTAEQWEKILRILHGTEQTVPEVGERLDAERYRHIKAKESSFIVMYYGSRILGGDKSRRQVLTPELDDLIDSEMNNL